MEVVAGAMGRAPQRAPLERYRVTTFRVGPRPGNPRTTAKAHVHLRQPVRGTFKSPRGAALAYAYEGGLAAKNSPP